MKFLVLLTVFFCAVVVRSDDVLDNTVTESVSGSSEKEVEKEILTTTDTVITTTLAATTLPAADVEVPYDYNVTLFDKFVERFQFQMKCGYPKFGIPSAAPLEISYKFKQSFDFLQFKKIQVQVNDIVINGLDNFKVLYDNTTITNKRTEILLKFPEIILTGKSSINKKDGTITTKFIDVELFSKLLYDDVNKKNVLLIKDVTGSLHMNRASLNLTNIFPKSPRLAGIWNKALGDSLPVVLDLLNERTIQMEFIDRLVNGVKYYAINIANNGLATYKLDFKGLVESIRKFTNNTEDSLMCEAEDEDYDIGLFKNIKFEF